MALTVQIRRTLLFSLLLYPLYLYGMNGGQAVKLEIHGVIGPATSDYISRGLEYAEKHHASLVILTIDTPGGLDSSMREIIRNILSSPIPVVSYVSPGGARAASAGTYILYASQIAAMSPATNIGAATPVQIGGLPDSDNRNNNQNKHTRTNADPMKKKIINDAVAYIRGLAELHDRNADWAEKAVRDASSLSATEALKNNVIDLIAKDIRDLLNQLDGHVVTSNSRTIRLSTHDLSIETFAPDWRSRLLSVITDPNMAYILMLIGVYGLIYEFANPGMILPGVAGTISLLLALFAFQVLPINYTGLALMLIGIAFMVGEIYVPSFGALGIGGIIAFVIGSVILLDTDIPGYGISIPLIVFFALLSAGLLMFVLGMALRARKRPVVSGMEELVGGTGMVIDDFNTTGRIKIHSETWNASTQVPLKSGQQVRVTGIHGLSLTVEPYPVLSPDKPPAANS